MTNVVAEYDYYTLDQAKREEKRKNIRKALLKKALRITVGTAILITGLAVPVILTLSTELLAAFEVLAWAIIAMLKTATMLSLMGLGTYLIFKK